MRDTKEYILIKAFRLFITKSYREVTLRDIVQSTGLSKGAFYHYFASKEQVYEQVVHYFYNHIMITDYSGFPTGSFRDFYRHYLDKLGEPSELDDLKAESNLFLFIAESSRRVESFAEIHAAQRQVELSSWARAISAAKERGEIVSEIPDRQLAEMFLYISDGSTLTALVKYPDRQTLETMKTAWDNLFSLISARGCETSS
ncbi:MAG: TetR/AcrR family transcriptional regulator [Rikenellaceae bacterium]|nr:TetR/AcrR family transcriptional regulator [Rikenellaceae bacterium]